MLTLTLNHLWQSTLYAALAGIACLLLGHERARVRYWLWWSASIKFALPFGLLVSLGARLASLPAALDLPFGVSSAVSAATQPIAAATLAQEVMLGLAAVWLAGSTALAVRWVVRGLRLRTLIRNAETGILQLDPEGPRIRLAYTPEVVEPGVVGLFSPVLLMPAGLERALKGGELVAVIAHEMSHIRHRDNLTAATHMIVETLFWFHPLVWWIGGATRIVEKA